MKIGLPAIFVCAAAGVFAPGASASEIEAIRPGLACVSEQALARLTLPDGSSRSEGWRVRPWAKLQKVAGGCHDLARGETFTVIKTRHNTSIVRSKTSGGQIFYVANIDFQQRFGRTENAPLPPPAPLPLPSPAPAAAIPDVAGLTVGMDYLRAKEVLSAKHLEAPHVVRDADGNETGIFASSATEGFLVLMLDGKVAYIGNEERFPAGIASAALNSMLRTKYGAPTVDWRTGASAFLRFSYVYDANWTLMTKRQVPRNSHALSTCFVAAGTAQDFFDKNPPRAFGFLVPDRFPADCEKGMYIDSEPLGDSRSLIGLYTVVIYDAQAYIAHPEAGTDRTMSEPDSTGRMSNPSALNDPEHP